MAVFNFAHVSYLGHDSAWTSFVPNSPTRYISNPSYNCKHVGVANVHQILLGVVILTSILLSDLSGMDLVLHLRDVVINELRTSISS